MKAGDFMMPDEKQWIMSLTSAFSAGKRATTMQDQSDADLITPDR
jgi:hypothetical protein